jgi:flagellar motor switch protein FliM
MFTSIELRIMQKIVKDALLDMEKAWAPLQATKMSLVRMEMNPRLVNIVPPEHHVVAMQLEIQIDNMKGAMVFAFPYMTVEPLREKLKNGVQFDLVALDPKWSYSSRRWPMRTLWWPRRAARKRCCTARMWNG